MTKLEITLEITMTISILGNVGLFLYARAVVVRLLSLDEELWDLQEMIDAFAKHTKSVYELESFYGDQTLQGLLQHAVSLNEQLETFEYIYTLTEKEEQNLDNAEDDNTEIEAEEAS